ncbi:hypothetical protein CDAR_478271 [Caerostris darwini]|uniref:Uncharacterized protein n=1 Tax=Caerostris darwini TaxID=1538125 RepID=A0AAV4VFN2_9ARAC|nr:hypothetical protein CDAR_478271 [Caerostris darwini]
MRTKALREMICDKVSRRVQKGLGGRLTEDMWNVEEAYFKGLTEDWVVIIFQRLCANEFILHVGEGEGYLEF